RRSAARRPQSGAPAMRRSGGRAGCRGLHRARMGPGRSGSTSRAGVGMVAVAGGRRRWRGGCVAGRSLRAFGRIEYFTPNHTEGSDMRELLAVKECEFPSASMRYDARIISEPDLNWFDPAYPALAAEPVTEGGRQAAWFVRCGSHD